jgi:hypothetical protein
MTLVAPVLKTSDSLGTLIVYVQSVSWISVAIADTASPNITTLTARLITNRCFTVL